MLHLYTWCDIHGKMGCLCPCVYFNLVFDLVCMVCECVCDGVTVCVSVYVCDHIHVCVCVCYITGPGIDTYIKTKKVLSPQSLLCKA